MSNASLCSCDYDAIRIQNTSYANTPRRVRKLKMVGKEKNISHFIIPILVVSVLALVWYSLRFIPLFDVNRIEFTIRGGLTHLPQQATRKASQFYGRSLMGGSVRNFRESLEAIPTVKTVVVKRKLFSTLTVDLETYNPQFFIISDENYYFIEGNTLVEIDKSDYRGFENPLTVEIDDFYIKYLKENDFEKTINSLEGLAINLPIYDTILYLHQQVAQSQLREAIELIKLEQTVNNGYEIALGKQKRYDLYQSALVRRE
ncbi:MAG: FtsQ-type POTRA domain-containing protein [Sphaerochaetaceae bacterium]